MNNVNSPRTDDAGMEQRLQAEAVAPRVTLADIQANVVSEHFFTAFEGVTGHFVRNGSQDMPSSSHEALKYLTFCVLVLRNGFTVTGESAPASPENFNPQIGRDLAKANAMNKIWPLMGYELKSRLHREQQYGASNAGTPGEAA